MIVLDPGHRYQLAEIDGEGTENIIEFVKRQGEGYPGNLGHHAGTTCQEVLRVLIDRVKYLDNQIPCEANKNILFHLRKAIYEFEQRAANRHERVARLFTASTIEDMPVCIECGHIGCDC